MSGSVRQACEDYQPSEYVNLWQASFTSVSAELMMILLHFDKRKIFQLDEAL
jgi:hypothetical protein